VYGVNTGFGALADTPVGEDDLTTLQGAIVRSHAAAIGAPLDDETVQALLLLRARTLAAGYSGVRADLSARLLELLCLDLLPVIPGKGSVGASGDLAAAGAAGKRGQPARAAVRVAAAGQPPAQQACGAGRVLPALRAAGARRGQGRAPANLPDRSRSYPRLPVARRPTAARFVTKSNPCPSREADRGCPAG
jgi:hypothetical protein